MILNRKEEKIIYLNYLKLATKYYKHRQTLTKMTFELVLTNDI